MGWNEPGRDRDPWGGSNDVDEWFRRLRQRFQRRGGGPFGRLSLWWLAPLVLVGVWLLTGFYNVPSGRQAVVVRMGHVLGVNGPGLHWDWPWPISAEHVINTSEQRSLSQRALVLTRDGRLASAELKVSYRVSDPVRYLFGAAHPSDVLSTLAGAALTRSARTQTLSELRGGGAGAGAPSSASRLSAEAASLGLGVDIDSVRFTNIREPDAVNRARERVAKRQREAATAAASARSAAQAALADAGKRGHAIIAAAQEQGRRRLARARQVVARFKALLPAWRRDPETMKSMLRDHARAAVLAGAPKVVVSGPVRVVTIAAWPATGGVTVHATGAASASAPAAATGAGR